MFLSYLPLCCILLSPHPIPICYISSCFSVLAFPPRILSMGLFVCILLYDNCYSCIWNTLMKNWLQETVHSFLKALLLFPISTHQKGWSTHWTQAGVIKHSTVSGTIPTPNLSGKQDTERSKLCWVVNRLVQRTDILISPCFSLDLPQRNLMVWGSNSSYTIQ